MNRIVVFILLCVFAIGCTPTEKLKYTINEPDSRNSYTNIRSEKTIQPNDYLYIKIYSLDNTTMSIFENSGNNREDEQLLSYNVNENGFISFPFVGDIYLKDLTIDEAKLKLDQELNSALTDVSVRIRFVGNKITVIGEVNSPGNYTFFDEKITVFQAFGLANDIAIYGDKTNVTLIREKDNIVNYHYMDLTKKSIVESEFYYMLPNDILLVEPVKAMYRTLQDRSLLPLILSSITSVLYIYISVSAIQNSNK